jgi:AbrB family looped-hinge helix DNA binding protein
MKAQRQITVDGFGRIVIPKDVRVLLGVRSGGTLAMDVGEEEVRLRHVPAAEPLVLKDGVTVYIGELNGNIEDAVTAAREARTRHLSGLDD